MNYNLQMYAYICCNEELPAGGKDNHYFIALSALAIFESFYHGDFGEKNIQRFFNRGQLSI